MNDIRKKFDLSYDKDNDKEYWGKNANKGHYWANDNDGNKVYLGHNDNLSSLLNNSELEDASGSTKYDHDTDVARGLAGLLNHDPSKKIDKPKKKKEKPYEPPEPTPEYKEAKERANTYRKKLYRGDYLGINKRWEPDVDETDSLGLNKKWEPDESQSEDQQEELEPKQFANYNEDYLDKYKIDLIADYKKRKAQQITQELA